MKVGVDYRTALVNREGIGRATRELVRALQTVDGAPDLRLFGWTLAKSEVARSELGLSAQGTQLDRLRFPSRWIPRLCRVLGRGVDDLVGGCEVFHHTQTHVLPVRAAVETAIVFDCIWARTGSGLSEEAAARMADGVRAQCARARRVLVPSAFVADDLARTLGIERDRIDVALLGCDHVLRGGAIGPSKIQGPYVLTVSRVDARKNHVRMLRAFEALVRDGLPQRWVVAGPRGFGAEDFEAALAASSARDRVLRLDFVPDSELQSLYAGASAFLFASLDEGFGLPPLEAAALGVPVIASSGGSLPEVLAQGALLPDPLDAEAIAADLLAVLRDTELARDMARRGRARAAELSWAACARDTLACWRRALSGSPERPSGSAPA
ncbi:MAG: glycosyltransferase family 1 protein [Planctomycetota bacterium]|nr:glycosyltransferase family 1 protein [Planctomycetota bacterium]